MVLPPPIPQRNFPSPPHQEDTSTQTEPLSPTQPLCYSPETFTHICVFHHQIDTYQNSETHKLENITSVRVYYRAGTNDIHHVDIHLHINRILPSLQCSSAQGETSQTK